jgi:RNAse (barnase) inhibitor barstar
LCSFDGPAGTQPVGCARRVAAGRLFLNQRRIVTMLLQTVRPNIVQSIRAYRVDDLMQAAATAGQHFMYANLTPSQSKQEVLELIAESFLFPTHFGKNLDTLFDCMTDLIHKAGVQPGFVVVLDQIPDGPRFDREAREQLLDVFRDAADFWGERKVAFRCFYSFAVARTSEANAWDRVNEAAQNADKPVPKSVSKNGVNPNFGTNMPMMSSAFDTAMWLSAA